MTMAVSDSTYIYLQVEGLTRKAQLQEVELERTTKQLKEAIAIAGEETAKCKAAKEVIKSLTAQVRKMIPCTNLDGSLDVWLHLFSVTNCIQFLSSWHGNKPILSDIHDMLTCTSRFKLKLTYPSLVYAPFQLQHRLCFLLSVYIFCSTLLQHLTFFTCFIHILLAETFSP